MQLREHLWVVSKAQGVEGTTRVQVVQTVKDVRVELADARGVAGWALALLSVVLDSEQEASLDHCDDDQGQGVVDDAPWDGEVVQGATVEHLCAGLEPGATADGCTVCLETLWNDDTGSCQHGPPSVDQLIRAVLLHLSSILAELQRIVAIAAQQELRSKVDKRTVMLLRPGFSRDAAAQAQLGAEGFR